MTGKDLFVLIYCIVWLTLITLFVFSTKIFDYIETDTAVLISQVSFLVVTSIMVFVKPVRKFVDKFIISKLQ